MGCYQDGIRDVFMWVPSDVRLAGNSAANTPTAATRPVSNLIIQLTHAHNGIYVGIVRETHSCMCGKPLY